MNVFDTSPYLFQHGFTERAICLIKYLPKTQRSIHSEINSRSVHPFNVRPAVCEDEGCVVLRACISTDCHIKAVETL